MKRVLSIFFTENYLTKKIDAHIIQLDERWQKESRMKRGISLCIGILLLVGAGGVYADEVTENIQAIVIETFDDPTGQEANSHIWIARGSKYASVIETDQGSVAYPQWAYVESYPEALFRRPPEDKTLRVFGIHGKFDLKGYNYVEFFPVREENGEYVPDPIVLPGRVKEMDLWVWGSNHNYTLEAHIQDYMGRIHVLDFGSIKFKGWKNLRVKFPGAIQQAVQYVPSLKQLSLVKLVLWTTPEEKVDDFYVYIDQIKVLTDLFETGFDGDVLANPEQVQDLWANAPAPGRE
ncbi:flagellar filament outer layer protein FlaA [Spirochaeta thermophila DSM 6578]|uniref:Flagellar filament outer layer protein FlaA n=2 Tax=Winmispira thermophila TaxID=154 RepID=G0GFV0_WINT7|nr:flagellar filament outer layer protein FlaA [Spirochaeta thermophila DSM 6578]